MFDSPAAVTPVKYESGSKNLADLSKIDLLWRHCNDISMPITPTQIIWFTA